MDRTPAKFLQIHTLSPYVGALINREDTGMAKRLLYGGSQRIRISSQCLKRHWRMTDDPHSLLSIDGATGAARSRELVTHAINALRGRFPDALIDAIEPGFQVAVYGRNGQTRKGRPTLLLGEPEIEWLKTEAETLANRLMQTAGEDEAAAVEAAPEAVERWQEGFLSNMAAMRDATKLPGGIAGAMFGRMVTSDPSANISAPVHVAHAFTVHRAEADYDYFTAMDDLADDEPGADLIQTTEITSSLFYGYVVVDIDLLVANVSDPALAGEILHNLVYLIAEVSPGAKLGSTAPYSRASAMLLESGRRQPRTLAEAYRRPVRPDTEAAVEALAAHLEALDSSYETGEERMAMAVLPEIPVPRARRGSLRELADWSRGLVNRTAQ